MESGEDSNELSECDDLADHATTVIDKLGSWWKIGKDAVQDIAGDKTCFSWNSRIKLN